MYIRSDSSATINSFLSRILASEASTLDSFISMFIIVDGTEGLAEVRVSRNGVSLNCRTPPGIRTPRALVALRVWIRD